MGKIVLCSKKDTLIKLQKHICNFQISGNVNGNFGFLVTYSKLSLKTDNLYEDNNGNFVIGVGTYIYRGTIGKSALKRILEDTHKGNCLQNKILGSFCIVTYKCHIMNIYVDEASTYDIYYTLEDNNIILSNTYYHVASAIDSATIDETGLIENWLFHTIDATTPIKNVRKLMGTERLCFDNCTWNIISGASYIPHSGTDIVEKTIELYKDLPHLFRHSGVFMTGGQDSRLSLSLLLALGMKPTLYYGIGNSSDTFTKKEDLDIVNQIADNCNLDIKFMDWRISSDQNKDWNLQKYGELYSIYNLNTNIFKEFDSKIDADFVALGYFGEIYRTIEPIELYKHQNFTLDEFIDDLYLHSTSFLFSEKSYDIYRKKIKDQFYKICEYRGIDPTCLTKNDFQKLNTIYRQRWDTQMNNFVNLYCYSFPIFGNKILTDIVEQIPYQEKLHSKIIIKCIQKFYPQLLDIPFYSHINKKKLNRKTMELKDEYRFFIIKEYVRPYIKNKFFMRLARNIYYALKRDKKGWTEISMQYKEKEQVQTQLDKIYVPNNLVDLNLAIHKLDSRYLKRLLLLAYLLNKLN